MRTRRGTLALIAIGCVSLVAAFAIGISDNLPGFCPRCKKTADTAAFAIGISDNLPGLALCYLAVAAFILAFVHTWRQVRRFLILLGASLVGFLIFVVLHNLFYALAQISAHIVVLGQLLEYLHAVFFLVAILVCPAGFLIGAAGSVAMAVMRARGKRTSDEAR